MNKNFNGTVTRYKNLHKWVRKHKPLSSACEDCGATDKPLENANISGKYLQDISDYASVCRKCHRTRDMESYLNKDKLEFCINGHEYTPENTKMRMGRTKRRLPYEHRMCLTCYLAARERWYATRRAKRIAKKSGNPVTYIEVTEPPIIPTHWLKSEIDKRLEPYEPV